MRLDEFVGLPWEERGRAREGCDCWGLIRLVYAERFGVDLPSFADLYQSTADGEAVTGLINGHIGPWREIAKGDEQDGDGVLMSVAGLPRHIGVVVSPGLVLHSERGTGSRIESYWSMRLRRRVLGFYRHEGVPA